MFQELVAFDRAKIRESRARHGDVVRAHGDRVHVFCAHDPGELERFAAGERVDTSAVERSAV